MVAGDPQALYWPQFKRVRFMFTSWSVAPKSSLDDKEYFTSEAHAVDVAYDWSADLHGDTMVVFCNDQPWMEVVA